MTNALEIFHPIVADWFQNEVGAPTSIQAQAWPVIADGEHVLLSAPTGSGKTLSAFMWAIDRLVTGQWDRGATQVVYVSPIKALGVDIRRNLTAPLRQLGQAFRAAQVPFTDVRVEIRSGDTPAAERARMLRKPPEILVTTPESLNILLTSKAGRAALGQVKTVILDEIHAVAGNKRGTWLMSGVERLAALAGEFQRIALSATVRPLDAVADLVAGFQLVADGAHAPRRVRPLQDSARPQPKLSIVSTRLPTPDAVAEPGAFWVELCQELRPRIAAHRSTLIFTNSRKMAEKLARFLNNGLAEPMVYAHHGSLSKELRAEVERRLKSGTLPAVVATNSLELGIDIGDCEQVILIQTPRSVNSAVQRIGRANHQVDAIPNGSLHPTHGNDYLEAAVFAPLVRRSAIESLRPVRAPLDVLAQVLVCEVGSGSWTADALYDEVRRSWAFNTLTRPAYDLVLDMLCGRSGEERLRELRPLLRRDPVNGALSPRDGALLTFYANSGVIPDRGYFSIRLRDSNARIGELDEEFVWERSLGDVFSIGTQSWRIDRIDHNDVVVVPTNKPGAMPPFWRAEAQDRAFEVSEQIGLFLEQVEPELKSPQLGQRLQDDHCCDAGAAESLISYLQLQATATRGLPHRHRVIIEHCSDAAGQGHLAVMHASWGGRVLRPLAIALSAAWRERHGVDVSCSNSDSALMVQLPHPLEDGELLSLVDPESIERHLRSGLERTGFFGARFRENASRALLLPRRQLKRRLPLWLNRQRAKKLLQRVRARPDFPILAETWRTCLEDCFDLSNLRALLAQLRDGSIDVVELRAPRPSPFAGDLARDRVNDLMYDDDSPTDARPSALSQRVLEQVVQNASLRPRLEADTVVRLVARLHRTQAGYAPDEAEELLDLLRERLLIPWPEWADLLAACERDHGLEATALNDATQARACAVRLASDGSWCACAIDTLPRLLHAAGRELGEIEISALREVAKTGAAPLAPETAEALDSLLASYDPELDDALAICIGELLSNEGPLPPSVLRDRLGVSQRRVDQALDELEREGQIIRDTLLSGSEALVICDRENLERALRLQRAARRRSLRPRPLRQLPLFLAAWQGLLKPRSGEAGLQEVLEQLFGFPALAQLWEADLLPARLQAYAPALMDAATRDGPLQWFGCGRHKASFCFRDGLGLFRPDPEPPDQATAEAPLELVPAVFPEPLGRYDYSALLEHSGMDSQRLTELLWERVWQGEVAADSLEALRQGIRTGYKSSPAGTGRRRFGAWRATRPFAGAWQLLRAKAPHASEAPLDALEWDKQRVRVLLDRYGILFRELLIHELGPLQWRGLQPALRTMELAGEVIGGHYLEGLGGLQFASPEALQLFEQLSGTDAVYMVNACDPVSTCGLGLDELDPALPQRVAGNHLVFHDEKLALISRRQGGEITITCEPDHPDIPRYLEALSRLLSRAVDPVKGLLTTQVNGVEAKKSPYAKVLTGFGFAPAYRGLELQRRYD